MKTLLFFLVPLLLSVSLYAENPKLQATFDEWDRQAAKYQGVNTDLSVPSKRAIVLGQPELAEKPYLVAYNNKNFREQYGQDSLYQIFLVYIEPTNSARNLSKAKYYLDKMVEEWPDGEQTKKARHTYEKTHNK